jgi:hypothetical protein
MAELLLHPGEEAVRTELDEAAAVFGAVDVAVFEV